MNANFLNHKTQRKDMLYIEGEDNITNNLKEICGKVDLIEKLLMDDNGLIDNVLKIDKKLDDFIELENDKWVTGMGRVDRIESKISEMISKSKNDELNLKENVKEEEEDKEEVIEDDEEEEEKEDVLNVTPNPEDDIKVDN